jgi:prepilin-type N-terminal cleavage/methylation domain-containing protein
MPCIGPNAKAVTVSTKNPEVKSSAFTLIELSIVLVIIGLIVGGVLFGRDLIEAAKIRKQASYLQQLDIAVSTFYGKYSVLPGDMTPAKASAFGFVTRGGNPGCGNGDGYIGSYYSYENVTQGFADFVALSNCGGVEESILFFMDLQQARLISTSIDLTGSSFSTPVENLSSPLQVGDGFLIAASGSVTNHAGQVFGYLLIGYPKGEDQYTTYSAAQTTNALSSEQAFGLDSKLDDGNPLTGTVYTLTEKPGDGGTPVKGVYPGCSLAGGTYDFSTPNARTCFLKVKGILPGG